MHNISNRRAGGLIWTIESTFFVMAAFSPIKPSIKPHGSLLMVDHQTKLTTLQSAESGGEALWNSDKKSTTRQGLIFFFPRVITWLQLARIRRPREAILGFWKNVPGRVNSSVWFLKVFLFVNFNQNWTNRVTRSARSYLLNYFIFYRLNILLLMPQFTCIVSK